ncbi:hypothetical protein [Ruegeria lacuscaerulensis]|uniref:hypothetical protein n=1 Tax=Ruegeria lacuscaerulensis TaxID=55218 RepID=UPI001F35C03B|nr:hypothetical protein [Ruegeria lacuscaerulensis]
MLTDAAPMYRALYLLFIILLASPAWSGAWLRGKDSAFTAASVTVFKEPDQGYDYASALYAEWGARDNLTIGFDFEENRDLYGHATVFARIPVADLQQKGRFAAEFGVGVHHRYRGAWALYKATLSYGKGYSTGWGNGWVALDASLEYRTHDALYRKLDLTTGLNSARLINPLLQVETAYRSGSSLFWRVRPSAMIRWQDSPTTWVLGLERKDARNDTGIKLAIWSEF